jgi:hypothetical protein
LSVVLAISDLHFPHQHPDAFDWLAQLKLEFKPDKIICLGDEVEMAAMSFHDLNPDAPSAGHEYQEALACMKTLYKIFPTMDICTSNHGSRLYRRAFKHGIPEAMVKAYRELWEAPKTYNWHGRIVFEGVVYEHGDGGGSGRNAAFVAMQANRMSTVIGHIHSFGGVQYSATPFGEHFALNTGCLINLDSQAFLYAEKYRNKPTLGLGLVVDGKQGHFLRMPL